jgi:uncharacterized protein YjiK
MRRHTSRIAVAACVILTAGFLSLRSGTAADAAASPVRRVRLIKTGRVGVSSPAGLAFSPRANAFVVVGERGARSSELRLIGPFRQARGAARLAARVTDPINMAFDVSGSRLLVLERATGRLLEIPAGADGQLGASRVSQVDVRSFGAEDPQGMTVDASSGALFVLDGARRRFVRVEREAGGRFDGAVVSVVPLERIGAVPLRGLALDPRTGHLHVMSPAEHRLYEVSQAGELVATRELSTVALHDPQGMTFAPSGDLTDDPAQLSLYVGDAGRPTAVSEATGSSFAARAVTSGGGIVELSLDPPPEVAAASFVAPLVSTTLTSQFEPPSPDPSGIVYLPFSGTLWLSDGEVDEMDIYAGANVFETTLGGNLLGTRNTLSFSNEPTGVGVNPGNRHLFYSDDDKQRVFEVNPGPDGLYHTGDDAVTSFSTVAYGDTDPEGLVYDASAGVIWISDGLNAEVYRVTPGVNGRFDGVPPAGDDVATHFDTAVLGILDPEGIALNADNGHLYVVGKPETQVAEITTAGELVQMIDISAANAVKPAGLTYAPSSLDAGEKHLYIVDRGIDNDSHPTENDGKLYEMALSGGAPVNAPPSVNAGVDRTVTLPASVALDGTVADDGLPNPPATVTTTWTTVSGPGTVSFVDPSAVDTTASFSGPGAYVLRLTASDGALGSSDDVAIDVLGEGTIEVRIAAGADDVEEYANGRISRSSDDLELVNDLGKATGDQTIGLRFRGLSVPRGAVIVTAWIQFKADEVNSGPTTLAIRGQAADNAPAFTNTNFGVSSRPRTAASIAWSPAPWAAIGDAGASQRTPDLAPVFQEIVDRTGWASGSAIALIITGTGIRVAESYEGMSAGAALLHLEYSTAGAPVNQAPVVNAGPDQAVTLPASAALDGTVTDDGLPNPPAALTTTWSTLSGPGTVTFGNPNAIDTTASFSAPGAYVLRLTASDGARSANDDVTVDVRSSPVNQPPTVTAGPDAAVTLPASAALDGTVTDDGLPNPPGAVTTTWSKVSGPGTVAFANASAVDTTASFDAPGTYVLRLTASDGALSSLDDLTITANTAGQATLSVSRVGAIHDATDANSYAFAPFVAANDRLYVVFLSTSVGLGTAPAATSVAGAGLTFTEIGVPGGFVYSGSPGVRRMQAWRALVSSGAASGSVAVTLNGASTGLDAVLLQFAGMDTSGTNGSGAIVQSGINKASGATSLTVGLSSFSSAANRPVAFFNHRVTEPTTPEAGYTELDDASHGTPSAGAQCQWHASAADATPSASWATAADVGGFAIEVKAGP